jgi:hypothetical protein
MDRGREGYFGEDNRLAFGAGGEREAAEGVLAKAECPKGVMEVEAKKGGSRGLDKGFKI